MSQSSKFRLGCDIGGTFTDFILLDQETGRFEIEKVLTTPDDPSHAVDDGIADLADRRPEFPAACENIIHGTTLVINALIERKGAVTAIVATEGFADLLEMRKEIRYDIYDIAAVYPTPLVPREHRFELAERVIADGAVLRPLENGSLETVLGQLYAAGIESVAVVLLHAYANPVHEQKFAAAAASAAPDLIVTLSSDVLPEIKEYERTCTTAINAYVRPLVDRYLARLEDRLRQRGFDCGLYLMLSGGGIIGARAARRVPVRLIESGPVGGAIAASHIGKIAGVRDVVSFDMGGTTAKGCLIRNGDLPIATSLEVDRVHRFKRGSGTPVGVPTVDLVEIGAGGGSIASVDDLGLIQVGPQSAGADPGPICYSLGGTLPTVTDANLVLGYLDPDYFLGGTIALDTQAARRGVEQVIGSAMQLSVEEAAWGIREVVNENMASAFRMYVAERGGDLPAATLVAFGGAGPLHADGVGRKLGIRRIIVPRAAGVFSALGFLVSPVSYEVSRTAVMRLSVAVGQQLESLYRELEATAGEAIAEATSGLQISFERIAEMSYLGQGHQIRVAVPAAAGSANGGAAVDIAALESAFATDYRRHYGYAYNDLEAQIVTLRVLATAQGPIPEIVVPFADAAKVDSQKAIRPAYDPSGRRFINHAVHAMDRLYANQSIAGPAIIEERESTLIVGIGAVARADPRGWVEVTIGGEVS